MKDFVVQKLHKLSTSIHAHEFYATIFHKFLLIYLHIKASCDLAQTKCSAVVRQGTHKLFGVKHYDEHFFSNNLQNCN